MPGVPDEANLPASPLMHDHVVFDYPARRLTVARHEMDPLVCPRCGASVKAMILGLGARLPVAFALTDL